MSKFQTLEDNGIHSTVYQAIFIVLLNLQNTQDNKNHSVVQASCFHCLSCFTNSREQQKMLGKQPRGSIVLDRVFGNPGKTFALVYEILRLNKFTVC